MTIRRCSFAFILDNSEVYRLNTGFECQPQHSFSAIYATSNYLLKHFPQLFPPLPQGQKQQILSKTTNDYNPLYEFWNDYLVDCSINEMSIRHEDMFYILIPLRELFLHQKCVTQQLTKLTSIEIQWFELSNRQKISRIFSVPLQESIKKIGIYLTQPLNIDSYKPRLNKSTMYHGIFFNNQKWEIFNIPDGKIPEAKDLLQFDSIIITGSSCSVLNQSNYVVLAVERLIQAYQQSQRLKIFGFCYGHQLIAKYFGAEVVKKSRQSKLQRISFRKEIVQKYSYLKPLQQIVGSLYLTQYHEDYVQTIPNGFQLLSFSQSCKIQALVSNNGRIFTTQFHSQILFNFIKGFSDCLQNFGIKLGFKIDQSNDTIEKNIKDSVEFLKIIQKFIGL